MPPLLLAHGFADPAALPVPLAIVLWGGGAVVVGAAAWVGRSDTAPRRRTQPLPRLTALVDAAALRLVLRSLVLAMVALLVWLALAGPDDPAINPVPRMVFALWWPLLVPISLLLGAAWRVANPLRLLADGLARATGDPDEELTAPLPDGVGVWPAALLLAVFVWAEQVASDRPSTVLIVLLLVAAAVLLGANRYGRAWFGQGDPFEVFAGLLAVHAPVGREPPGMLALRSPRRALAAMAIPPGLLALISVLLAAHLFDAVLETLAWQNLRVGLSPGMRPVLDTVGLMACATAVWALSAAATARHRELQPALLPLVAGYAIAHHLPVLLIDGQVALVQLSDPLGRGWDLLGTAGMGVSYEALTPEAASLLLVTVLVVAHVAAVVVAHDRAVARYDRRTAAGVQLPLRALLVASMLGSLALRFLGGG